MEHSKVRFAYSAVFHGRWEKRVLNRSDDSMQGDSGSAKKAKLLGDVNSQFNNRFAEDADGPYQVILVDCRDEFNIGNLHTMVIGKKFRTGGISVVNIDKQPGDKSSILFHSAGEANEFVFKRVKELDNNWAAYIPDSSLQYTGIIRDVPIEFDKDEIIEGVQDSTVKDQIINVFIIKKRVFTNKDKLESNQGNGNLEDTDSIKIIFKNKLPGSIYINFCYRKVYKFIPPVRRCFQCQKYGHMRCKSDFRCVNCGKKHREDIACEVDPYCIICEGKHKASDNSCPFYKFYKEVNKVKTIFNKNYFEAQEIVKNRLLNIFNNNKDNSNSSTSKIVKSLNLDISVLPEKNKKSINPDVSSTLKNNEAHTLEEVQNEIILSECNRASVNAKKFHSELVSNFLVDNLGEDNEIVKQYKQKESNYFGMISRVGNNMTEFSGGFAYTPYNADVGTDNDVE